MAFTTIYIGVKKGEGGTLTPLKVRACDIILPHALAGREACAQKLSESRLLLIQKITTYILCLYILSIESTQITT